MAKVAFEPRAEYADGLQGSTSLPDSSVFDVGEALSSGGGKIVLNPDPGERKDPDAQEKENERAARDAETIEALDRFPGLKRTTVSSNSEKKGAGS